MRGFFHLGEKNRHAPEPPLSGGLEIYFGPFCQTAGSFSQCKSRIQITHLEFPKPGLSWDGGTGSFRLGRMICRGSLHLQKCQAKRMSSQIAESWPASRRRVCGKLQLNPSPSILGLWGRLQPHPADYVSEGRHAKRGQQTK